MVLRFLWLLGLAACTSEVSDPVDAADANDAGENQPDAAIDGVDAAETIEPDASVDASVDAGMDASVDAGAPLSLARAGETFEIATIAEAAPKRFVEVAYDPDHRSYLVVHGNAAIGGAFLDEAGSPHGPPFAIADTAAWTQAPRLAWGEGAFLVAWHDTRNDPNLASVHARLVSFDGTQPQLLSDGFAVTARGTNGEMPPSVAYSIASREFLVTWQNVPEGTISGQRIDTGGALIGLEIEIAGPPHWHGDPNVAWNPIDDEFFVVHTGYVDGVGASLSGSRIRVGTGEHLGTTMIAEAAGTWIPQLAYTPTTDRFFVVWYDGAIQGRAIERDGTADGEAFIVAPGYGAYDGLALAYDATLDRFAATFHGTNDEDWACAIDNRGTFSTPLQATDSPGTEGNFNPRITAGGGAWLLVSSRGFATVVGQILGP